MTDTFGSLILLAMALAAAGAVLTAGFSNVRWWLAALVGTVVGEAAFLYWVPFGAWSTWMGGFLPFAAASAFAAAIISKLIRKKVRKWRA